MPWLTTPQHLAIFASKILRNTLGDDHQHAMQDNVYGGTHELVHEEFPSLGIEYTTVAPQDPAQWERALRPNTKAGCLASPHRLRNNCAMMETASSLCKCYPAFGGRSIGCWCEARPHRSAATRALSARWEEAGRARRHRLSALCSAPTALRCRRCSTWRASPTRWRA